MRHNVKLESPMQFSVLMSGAYTGFLKADRAQGRVSYRGKVQQGLERVKS